MWVERGQTHEAVPDTPYRLGMCALGEMGRGQKDVSVEVHVADQLHLACVLWKWRK